MPPPMPPPIAPPPPGIARPGPAAPGAAPAGRDAASASTEGCNGMPPPKDAGFTPPAPSDGPFTEPAGIPTPAVASSGRRIVSRGRARGAGHAGWIRNVGRLVRHGRGARTRARARAERHARQIPVDARRILRRVYDFEGTNRRLVRSDRVVGLCLQVGQFVEDLLTLVRVLGNAVVIGRVFVLEGLHVGLVIHSAVVQDMVPNKSLMRRDERRCIVG